ncbi:uncharacterized protein LOC106157932 isoform X2 [Lingula anatina]|uniref:Uncharacterized protein LOC106157932 isoform X2 n=1 Tax=Lingula anatina TaxID=7574 RepID=A0A1S3HT42_LINAN|nr:uncharacterized protein LOC106157932 isoform X2 [Lingula anatina]|eukprot:XP_013389188.1 uncharacterized protein LOC106157932 isoform X2 [Lingula anatina]
MMGLDMYSSVSMVVNYMSVMVWAMFMVVLTSGRDVGLKVVVRAHSDNGKIVRDYYMDTTDFCSSNRKMHNFSLAINEVIHIHGIHAASRVPSFPPKACSQGYHGKVARYFVIEITKFEIRNCDVTLTILSGLLQKYSLLRVYNCRNYTNEVLHVYADSFIFLLGKKYTRTSEYYFDIKLSTLDPGSSINGATASRHVAAYSSFQFCLKVSFLLTFLNSHMSPPR